MRARLSALPIKTITSKMPGETVRPVRAGADLPPSPAARVLPPMRGELTPALRSGATSGTGANTGSPGAAAGGSNAGGAVGNAGGNGQPVESATTNVTFYVSEWPQVPAGEWVLTAVATDDQGQVSISQPVRITVRNISGF